MNPANLPLWLTEDVTWPVLWGILVIAIFGVTWFITQRMTPLLIALACGLLLIGAVVIESQVVTDREFLVNSVYQMADAVRKNDADGVASFISDELPVLKDRIHREKKLFHVDSCSVIGFRNVELLPDDRSATAANVAFSVFGSGTYTSRSLPYTGALAVSLKFKKIKGEWSISEFAYAPSNAPDKLRTYSSKSSD